MERYVFAATALLLGAPLPAASDADFLREMRDRAEISELAWNYVRAIDTLDEDAYVRVFTPDGAFNSVKGSAALRKMVTDLKQSRAGRVPRGEPPQPAMHHIDTNETVRFIDRDHARVNYYWMTVFAGTPTTQPPRVAAAGRGVDDLVRVNGKWLIQSRNVSPKD